jgi:hypothetical protein
MVLMQIIVSSLLLDGEERFWRHRHQTAIITSDVLPPSILMKGVRGIPEAERATALAAGTNHDSIA